MKDFIISFFLIITRNRNKKKKTMKKKVNKNDEYMSVDYVYERISGKRNGE